MTDEMICVTEDTGEIVTPDRPGDITAAALREYAEAVHLAELARLDYEQRVNELIGADERARELAQTARELNEYIAGIEEALTDQFSDETRLRLNKPIKFDAGIVKVTWPKPRETYTMRRKPKDIYNHDPQLADSLGIERKLGKPGPAKIRVVTEG